jgi:hypothetical protein
MIIKKNLNELELLNFKKRFTISNDFDCSFRENIWRRHQCEENTCLSGWKTSSDRRRRLVHFIDKYDIVDNNFCLSKYYLRINLHLPISESLEYENFLSDKIVCNDLFSIKYISSNIDEYNNLDIILKSNNFEITDEIMFRPLRVFNNGIRKVLPRGNPKYVSISDIKNYFPAHVELGCGPSISSGIPPLNYFHKLFCLSKNGKFVFSFKDDDLVRSIINPFDWYSKTSYMQKMCLEAVPTNFYYTLKSLIESGLVMEPIFNNNFDGLSKTLDINELCLRKYDSLGKYPDYSFSSKAKSLIVIGSHADRRGCQQAARRAGLQIIYIDPEGYLSEDGNFISYPLESPQDNDLIVNLKADDINMKEFYEI